VDGSHNSMVPHSVVPHSEFEYFWSVYPRREKKEDAHSQYVAAVEAGVSRSLLTDKAGRFARSVVGKDPKYIPYPATWLRDKRWTDDYAAASNNPYYEEDLQYPPPPPGMDPGVWRGIMRCRVAREQR